MLRFVVSYFFFIFIFFFFLLAVFEGPGFLPMEKTSFSGISVTEEGSELGSLSLQEVYFRTWTGKASTRSVVVKNSNLSNIRVTMDSGLPGADDVVAVTVWPILSHTLIDPGNKNQTTTSVTAGNLVIWVKSKEQKDAWESWLSSVERMYEHKFLRPNSELRKVAPKKLTVNY